jgi:hypothetical protein
MMAKAPSQKVPGPGSPARFKGKPRGPARNCKVGNLTNAMKVVAKHGGDAHIEIMPDGRIIILTGQDHPTTQAGDDLDKWMADKNARQA